MAGTSCRGLDISRPDLPPPAIAVIGASGEPQRAAASLDGRFELALEPGSYKAYATAPEYFREKVPIEVAKGQGVTRIFRLSRGASLTAQVVYGAGSPASQAMVIAAGGDGRVVRGARTKPDGTVDVNGLAAGTFHLFPGSESAGFVLQDDVTSGTRVRFQFRDEAGKPLARTRVSLELLRVGGTLVGQAGLGVLFADCHHGRGGCRRRSSSGRSARHRRVPEHPSGTAGRALGGGPGRGRHAAERGIARSALNSDRRHSPSTCRRPSSSAVPGIKNARRYLLAAPTKARLRIVPAVHGGKILSCVRRIPGKTERDVHAWAKRQHAWILPDVD
jgi:hypothetical protein